MLQVLSFIPLQNFHLQKELLGYKENIGQKFYEKREKKKNKDL
jgi:hypothetical protein